MTTLISLVTTSKVTVEGMRCCYTERILEKALSSTIVHVYKEGFFYFSRGRGQWRGIVELGRTVDIPVLSIGLV